MSDEFTLTTADLASLSLGHPGRSVLQKNLDDLKARWMEMSEEERPQHAAELEAAYAAFQKETMGQTTPQPVVEITETPVEVPLTADVAVAGDAGV